MNMYKQKREKKSLRHEGCLLRSCHSDLFALLQFLLKHAICGSWLLTAALRNPQQLSRQNHLSEVFSGYLEPAQNEPVLFVSNANGLGEPPLRVQRDNDWILSLQDQLRSQEVPRDVLCGGNQSRKRKKTPLNCFRLWSLRGGPIFQASDERKWQFGFQEEILSLLMIKLLLSLAYFG